MMCGLVFIAGLAALACARENASVALAEPAALFKTAPRHPWP
jgi:hypothetical protein